MSVLLQLDVTGWCEARRWVMPLRQQVFVVEQGVPPELELDAFDPVSRHAIGRLSDGEVVGTGRLLPDGHVGRLAVAALWRGRGVGSQVLQALMAEARARGLSEIALNAQAQAVPFYLLHGFIEEGAPFLEAGLPHQGMRRRLR